MKKVIRAATAFEDEVMSNPTWQMANDICKQYGYEFDKFARVIVEPNGNKYIDSIKITATNENRPVIYIEFPDDKAMFELNTQSNIGRGFYTREEMETQLEFIQDAVDLTYELEDINFWDLHESEEEF